MKILKIALFVIAPIVFLIGMVFISYVSAHNMAVKHEEGIEVAHRSAESALGTYGQQIAEMAQVPGMQADDIKDIFRTANESRYGPEGNQAIINMITEQNPQMNSEVYTRIQDLVINGRNEYDARQKMVTDRVGAYRSDLRSFWTGKMMRLAGFPSTEFDFKKYELVTTQRAADAFERGMEDGPINLRPN